MTESNKEQLVLHQLQAIGDDKDREGILETPSRVVRSWGEIYRGYGVDPKSVFKTFDNPNEVSSYDGIVISRNIAVYSMCEHHMLPFYGVAHVGYIPDKKVIGISKLTRLLNIYTRRLQIQERINQQVVDTLMKYLKPKGAVCYIDATHMCMRMRGVNEDNASMQTINASGIFLDPEMEAKFLKLISL